jgi:hypothetical protein
MSLEKFIKESGMWEKYQEDLQFDILTLERKL